MAANRQAVNSESKTGMTEPKAEPGPKPIETFYNGILYRSKLEACWAAFFDHLDVRHDYELDAYALDAGNYTPDFWLPDVDDHGGMWIEIKGRDPKKAELLKCRELHEKTGYKVALFIGMPMRHVIARIGDRNVILWSDGVSVYLSNLLGVLVPDANTAIIHHAGVMAHQAVRWSPDITGKINRANKSWSKRKH